MILRKDAKTVSRRKKIDVAMKIFGILALLMLVLTNERWRDMGHLIPLGLFMLYSYYRGLRTPIAAPHIEIGDDSITIDQDRIWKDDVDLAKSSMSKKRLQLYHWTSWKDTLRADLSLFQADDVEALKRAIWGKRGQASCCPTVWQKLLFRYFVISAD